MVPCQRNATIKRITRDAHHHGFGFGFNKGSIMTELTILWVSVPF